MKEQNFSWNRYELEYALTLVTAVRILVDSGWWSTNLDQGTRERGRKGGREGEREGERERGRERERERATHMSQ